MKNQWLTINQLDRQLQEWQTLHRKYQRPRNGWVKTLRKGFGMTAAQLAEYLGVARSRIAQLEEREKHDAVTLTTLKKVAEAMGCELIYAIVPKNGKTLEDIIKAKATEVAEKTVRNVSHSMTLEKQTVSLDREKEQIDALTKQLLDGSLKKIW